MLKNYDKKQRERMDKIASIEKTGKIACLLCGLYYKKPLSHVWQRHGINEREYKKQFGLDHKKGICSEETKEILRDHIKKNYNLVVEKNLLKNGKKSRFKKNGVGVGIYKRSDQTINRLKQQFKIYGKRTRGSVNN